MESCPLPAWCREDPSLCNRWSFCKGLPHPLLSQSSPINRQQSFADSRAIGLNQQGTWGLCRKTVSQSESSSAVYNKNLWLTSSMTSFGEATRIAIPMSANLSSTSWKSKLRLDLALDRARPCRRKSRSQEQSRPLAAYIHAWDERSTHSSMTGGAKCLRHPLFCSS